MSLADIARRIGRGNQEGQGKNGECMGIIEFIESPFGLRFSKELGGSALFPVQRFILKMYYNEPLDDEDPYIRIPRTWRHIGSTNPDAYYEFTEVQYLEYLFNEGRCNIREQDHTRTELILPIGRRSGKSTISAMIAAYEAYKLLRKYDPQSYYGTPEGAPIQICSLATAKEQAAILYKEVRRHFNNCSFFAPFMNSETQSKATFFTPKDLETKALPSLQLMFYSAVAKGVRGAANIVAIMDEVAFFPHSGQGSSYEVYQALSPSLAQFSPKDPQDKQKPIGDSEGRMIMISSPYTRQGLFYDQYEMALGGGPGAKGLLMIQAPTWEVNPTIPLDYFEKEYEKNPVAFETEFGAQFTDKMKSWIERDEDLFSCVDPELKPLLKGQPREPHFLGLDLAPRGDRTVVTLTKLVEGKIQLAYHEQWQAKTNWRDINPHLSAPMIPYALNLDTVDTLDYEKVADWLEVILQRFYVIEGVFDRYDGIAFEQTLHKRGLKQLQMKQFQSSETSQMYQAFKLLMYNQDLLLYDYIVADDDPEFVRQDYASYMKELLELQGTARGKNIIMVAAPQVTGKHDDFADSLMRSVWLAVLRRTKHDQAHQNYAAQGGKADIAGMSYKQFQRQKARRNNYQSKRVPPKRRKR